MPVVLFVGSSGRSGSTLFDVLLQQVPGFVSVGELRHVFTRSIFRNQACGCGAKFWDCPFWNEVILRAFGPRNSFDPEAMWEDARPRIARKGIRFGAAALWFGSRARGEGSERWIVRQAAIRERLYHAVAEVSGARVIVDTSKMPEDAIVVSRVRGIQFRLLHLVRDPRGVAYSWSKPRTDPSESTRRMRRKGLLSSIEDWTTVNLIYEILCAEWPHLRVRYEDLIDDPSKWLHRALEYAVPKSSGPGQPDRPPSLAREELGFLRGRTAQIGETHTVSGNPLRFHQGPLELAVDDKWRSALSSGSRATITLATAPLLARYGYGLMNGA